MVEKTKLVGRKAEIAGLEAEWQGAAPGELATLTEQMSP